MNYQKIYIDIIENAKIKNRIKTKKTDASYKYYENHHIIPKCLCGNNEENNLVLLTAKEHYICHKLLTYLYKGNKKIANAFCRMTWDKNGKHNISSRDYAYAKELRATIPISEETRQKMRKPHGPMSEEHKKNVGKAGKGRKRTEESKRKQSKTTKGKPKINLQGKPSWNKGKTMSEEFGIKIGKANTGVSRNKGKKRTEEQKEHLRIINTGKKQSKETIEKRKKTIGEPWNKGLTKETDERLKKAGEKEKITKGKAQ